MIREAYDPPIQESPTYMAPGSDVESVHIVNKITHSQRMGDFLLHQCRTVVGTTKQVLARGIPALILATVACGSEESSQRQAPALPTFETSTLPTTTTTAPETRVTTTSTSLPNLTSERKPPPSPTSKKTLTTKTTTPPPVATKPFQFVPDIEDENAICWSGPPKRAGNDYALDVEAYTNGGRLEPGQKLFAYVELWDGGQTLRYYPQEVTADKPKATLEVPAEEIAWASQVGVYVLRADSPVNTEDNFTNPTDGQTTGEENHGLCAIWEPSGGDAWRRYA